MFRMRGFAVGGSRSLSARPPIPDDIHESRHAAARLRILAAFFQPLCLVERTDYSIP
jgi:hypothetical protein